MADSVSCGSVPCGIQLEMPTTWDVGSNLNQFQDGVIARMQIAGSVPCMIKERRWICGERSAKDEYVALCLRCAKALGIIW
jgi:hypothetical protein